MRNMQKNISFKCSVCGNDQFSISGTDAEDLLDAEDDAKIKCSDCGTIRTKREFIDDNSYIITENISDFKKEIFDKIASDLKRKLR